MIDISIKSVVFDWAGTTIDYGCFAPLKAIWEIFHSKGIEISMEEIRRSMGLKKRDHIEKLMVLDEIRTQWIQKFGAPPNKTDIDEFYNLFESKLLKLLPYHCSLIPGVVEVMQALRKSGLKIGSCTGYTKEMMNIIVPLANQYGYSPDAFITSSDVPVGRPSPFMCYKNAIELETYPMHCMVKVGDTITDIEEGLNAGMWTVAVILGSSELGLNQQEVQRMDFNNLKDKVFKVFQRFKQARAHYILESIRELPDIVDQINRRLKSGEHPNFPYDTYTSLNLRR